MFAGFNRARINAVDPGSVNNEKLPNLGDTGRPSKGGPIMRAKRYYVNNHLLILQKRRMKRYYTKVKDILSKYHYNSSLVMAELDKEIINYSKRSKLDESITNKHNVLFAIDLGREDGYMSVLNEEAKKVFNSISLVTNKEMSLKILNNLALTHKKRLNHLTSLWSAYLLLRHAENIEEIASILNEVKKEEKIKEVCLEKYKLEYNHLAGEQDEQLISYSKDETTVGEENSVKKRKRKTKEELAQARATKKSKQEALTDEKQQVVSDADQESVNVSDQETVNDSDQESVNDTDKIVVNDADEKFVNDADQKAIKDLEVIDDVRMEINDEEDQESIENDEQKHIIDEEQECMKEKVPENFNAEEHPYIKEEEDLEDDVQKFPINEEQEDIDDEDIKYINDEEQDSIGKDIESIKNTEQNEKLENSEVKSKSFNDYKPECERKNEKNVPERENTDEKEETIDEPEKDELEDDLEIKDEIVNVTISPRILNKHRKSNSKKKKALKFF